MSESKYPPPPASSWVALALTVFALAIGIYVRLARPASWMLMQWGELLTPFGLMLLLTGNFIGARRPIAQRALNLLSIACTVAGVYCLLKVRLG